MKPRLVFLLAVPLLAARLAAAEFTFGELTITVPDGFTLERVAAAPLVERPISAAYDERGRLYVTDSGGMTEKAEAQLAAKPHRIRRLVDTNGDGVFDRSTLFADKVMFPEGCLWYEGSLYVAAPPEIWKFTDTDDDGVADKREVWHDGKTLTGCANDLHGPYLGRDGWFYWTKGAYAEQSYTLPGGKPFVSRASHIFRARPDGSGLEPVLTGGMANPVGVAFTSTGERFLSCTFFVKPGGGRRDGLIHSIHGGVYGQDRDELLGHVMTGDLMPLLNHSGASAPCGMIAASRSLFGGGWEDNLLTCYFNPHKIVRHRLVPDGATFTTEDSDLVGSEHPDFHPTDVIEDADGSLLVVDTGGWYKVCCPTSQLAKPDVLGAIYRLRKAGAPKPADPRGLKITWAELPPTDLAKLLDDERHFVRERAIGELAGRGAAAVRALVNTLDSKSTPASQQNAVWALTRIEGALARAAIRRAIASAVAPVRLAAIHSAAAWRDTGARPALQKALAGGDAATARAAAEALGRIGGDEAARTLLDAAARLAGAKPGPSGAPEDAAARVLEHSLIYALIETGRAELIAGTLDDVLPASRRQGSSNSERNGTAGGTPAARGRAALVALDQLRSGKLQPVHVTPLLGSADPTLRRTAAWIVSHRPELGGQVAAFFADRLKQPPADATERAELTGQLALLAKSEAIQSLLVATITGAPAADSRRVALRAMADAGLKTTPPPWLDELARLLPAVNADVLAEAVSTARRLPQPKGGHGALSSALATVGRSDRVTPPVRLEALLAAGSLTTVEPGLFQFLIAHLDGAQPLPVRSAAAGVLAMAKLSPEQQLALADVARSVGPLELPKLLPAFQRGATEALGLKLVAALTESAGIRGLRVDLVQPLLAKYPKRVQEAGGRLLNQLNADIAKQTAQLEAALASLPAGDVRRGQAVFLSAKAACAACHQIGYAGGRLGPDLTNIGKVRNERDLLEAILFPNASFVRGYEPFTVMTKDGEDYTGILTGEAAEEVVMATGPQAQQRIARTDITELRPGAVSLMPQGMEDVLTKQELADVLAFLRAAQR